VSEVQRGHTSEQMEWGRFKATVYRYLTERERELIEEQVRMFGSFRDWVLFLVRRQIGGVSLRDIEYCGNLLKVVKEKIDAILPGPAPGLGIGRARGRGLDDLLDRYIAQTVERVLSATLAPQQQRLTEEEMVEAIDMFEREVGEGGRGRDISPRQENNSEEVGQVNG